MHLIFSSLYFGKHLIVFPVNIARIGKNTPIALEDITHVICLLSSMPKILTSFVPFASHILSHVVGTKWIPVWSELTTRDDGVPQTLAR
jgi:hypothetical protein